MMEMKPKKKRTQRLPIILLCVIVIGALIFFLRPGSQADAYTDVVVRTGEIATYYSFGGSVEVENSQRVLASAPATVRDIYVEKGEIVAKNDRLLRLSTGETLKAAVSGEIVALNVEKEDEVKPGDLLVEVMDLENMVVTIKVDEFDVHAVAPGQQVNVTINALHQTFTSTVEDVSKQAVKIGDISYYLASLSLPDDLQEVLPGMQVNVSMVNQKVENVVLIPMRAISFDDSGSPYVLVKKANGQKQETPIQVGVNDGIHAQVLGGLSSGETLLVPSDESVENVGLLKRLRGK